MVGVKSPGRCQKRAVIRWCSQKSASQPSDDGEQWGKCNENMVSMLLVSWLCLRNVEVSAQVLCFCLPLYHINVNRVGCFNGWLSHMPHGHHDWVCFFFLSMAPCIFIRKSTFLLQPSLNKIFLWYFDSFWTFFKHKLRMLIKAGGWKSNFWHCLYCRQI